MTVRVILASAALLALAASTAPAQNPPQPPPPRSRGSGRRMEMMFRGITLTAEQQARVDSIRARYRAQMPAFTPGTPPDSATREKMREHFRRMANEIRGVLTADQQQVWDKNLAEMQARRPGGP